jgi:signal transduction histidine kinase
VGRRTLRLSRNFERIISHEDGGISGRSSLVLHVQLMVAFWERGPLRWVVSVGLACVLIALAFLQYRWSQAISEATSTRMRANLQRSMMNFRLDLSRDLANLCLELQGTPTSSFPDGKSLSKRLTHWQNSTALRGIVQSVYVFKFEEDEDTRTLYRLVPEEGRLQQINWPSQLKSIEPLLVAALNPPLTGSNAASTKRGGKAKSTTAKQPIVGGIDQSIPLLIVPAGKSRFFWLLIELDPSVLQEKEFPQLARRYFGEHSSGDYTVGVVATQRQHSELMYGFDPDFLKDGLSSADAVLNLFGPPTTRGRAPQPPLDLFNTVAGTPPPEEPRFNGGGDDLFGPIRFDPMHYGSDQCDWFIAVKHRKGSVEAAVAELRQRNLAISFGVLLVLGASMALILYNSYRASRLAALQMEFVAGVSHELRTPVAAILSIADNIASGVVNDTTRFSYYGEVIRHQARQLNHFIEQVLRFATLRKTAENYQMQYVAVSDVLDEALRNTANEVAAAGVAVHSSIEPDLPLLCADPRTLSQCLQNLISNAVKYGARNDIQIRAWSVNGRRDGGEVNITVEDQGIGIAPSEIDDIFDPFYRSPQVAESDVHGTGLGLALAKSFAEAMGGRITVRSELGKGTAFTVHLPVESNVNLVGNPS